MNANSSKAAPLELSLVEIEPRPDEARAGASAIAAPFERAESEPRAAGEDRFLAEAAREYRDGHLDQPLWVRAIDRSGGDETVALEAYLQARAIALRLARREKRSEISARRGRVLHGADHPVGVADARAQSAPSGIAGVANRGATRKRLTIAAAVLGTAIALAWFTTAQRGGDSARPLVAADKAPSVDRSASAPRLENDQLTVRNAVAAPSAEEQARDMEAKVQQLMNAGNWNVLILHASEWTRKEPANANAWKQLSIGYTKLRQFNDASDAAEKAVQLAPTSASMWRNLGHVNVAAKEPEAALKAFDRATELNDQDAESFVLAGTLSVQLGRLPQARTAFDKAMAVSPGNADALCGQALIARKQGKSKEADAIVKQLKAVDKACADSGDQDGTAVAVGGASTYKTVPVRGR